MTNGNPGNEQSVIVSDIELLQRVQRGDDAAFSELARRYAQPLFRLACSLLGNPADAEDVLQETFAGAFKSAGGFRGQSAVKTWLVRILVRQAARYRRSAMRMPMRLDGVDPAAPSPLAAVDRQMDVAAVLQTLSQEHREVLVLREFEQLSYEEMAESLGVPRGTIESRLYRARQELKQRLSGYLEREL